MFCMMLFPTVVVHASQAQSHSARATSLPGVASSSAYAGYLLTPSGSNIANVGPLFPQSQGCGTASSTTGSSAASLSLGAFASSGNVVDTTTTARTATTASSLASSRVQSINILAGLISASAVNASASSQVTASSLASSNGSTFSGLIVAGNPIVAAPAANTTIPLRGVGFVVLNEQSGPANTASATRIAVTAIDVWINLPNSYGLPVGARILIAHAQSSFTRTALPATVNATSYGLYATGQAGSGFATSGPWANVSIGCTDGSQTVSLGTLTISNVGSTGAMNDTASGHITSTSASASGSSAVHQLNLLKGVITADTVTINAQASLTGNGQASLTLVNARVAGVQLADNLAPNTKITIPHLGYVIVNEQHNSVGQTSASAFDLVVTTSNTLGLPVGARIIVGHVSARVSSYA